MEKERLAQAIARIEQAAETLDKVRPPRASAQGEARDADWEAQRSALEAAHAEALQDKERTIAKLRADLDDIGKLKDEEIETLRARLQDSASDENTGVSDVEHRKLQEKYERLRNAAGSTLQGLDNLIARSEGSENG